MTRTLSLFCFCVLLAAGAAYGQAREKPVEVGEMAPDFTLVDAAGRSVGLQAAPELLRQAGERVRHNTQVDTRTPQFLRSQV